MKRNLFIVILLLILMILPINVLAKVKSYDLQETLKQELITKDLSDYKETDDQVTIYLFRGKGCENCQNFLSYLASIVDEYGEHFKLKSYEVRNNSDNSALMDQIATYLGYDPNDQEKFGVPFYIIGEKSFVGYLSSNNEDILNAIEEEYNKTTHYDIMDVLNINEDGKSNEGSNVASIIWTFAFVAVSTVTIVLFNHFEMKKINARLDNIERLARMKGSK